MTRTTEQIDPTAHDVVREFDRPRSVTVTIVGGSVDVVAAPMTDRAHLEVHELAGPPLTVTSDAGALKIEQVRGEDGQIWSAVKTMFSGGSGIAATARLTVSVPEDTTVSVRTVGADVLVGGSHGPVSVYTVNGAVALDRPTGRVDVTTVGGSVDAASPSGELKVKTVTGGITVQDAVLRSTRLNTVSGRMILDVRHGPSLVTANSVSGELTVRLPAGGGYDATVASTSGHVVVAGEPLVENGTRGGHRYAGDRSVVVKARTVTGDLVVLHRDGSPVPGGPGPVIGEPRRRSDVQDELHRDPTRHDTTHQDTPDHDTTPHDTTHHDTTWPRDPGDEGPQETAGGHGSDDR